MKFTLKGNYFNGDFNYPSLTGPDAAEKTIIRECPADLALKLWECPVKYGHVEQVVQSADKGFKTWRALPMQERINYLKKYQEQVLAAKEEIATAIALETGKPYWESLTEASALASKVDVTINESLPRIKAKHIKDIMPGTQGHVYFRPLGACLIIGPFNFPCHLANGQITSALISGNSIIFKPSEKTCYSAQVMIECFHRAGFPEGVINLIQGDGEIGRRLVNEKSVKGIFFTGSKEVGQRILSSTYKDLSKMVALELGGKNSSIICQDTNIEHALNEMIKACFLTSGQRCTSTSLIPIHESILEEFLDKFHGLAKKIVVDHPIEYEKEPFMGPLIDQMSIDNYLLFVGMAKREGIQEIMRGKVLTKNFNGHYVSPSIHLAQSMDPKSHFLMSEIFGPNATFLPFKEIEEAISMANATEYGLAASVFTKDKAIYEKCLQEIDAGILNLNRSTVGASARLPFGGVKNSGNYRPAAVATIDACNFQMASLEISSDKPEDRTKIKGLDL
ncbi:MAG: succinylglutamate-semialdehyde dehydrogenase [Epsilonproteobacteria bacterium]|nr:MAG: succinylglutamate-semialdehyde dehydrogenase [Campylobacterota bacterium]RLA67532.1 MAG: succinylglutamate-semialdehyde dehydrogenase [Campylobacterota bacterium]